MPKSSSRALAKPGLAAIALALSGLASASAGGPTPSCGRAGLDLPLGFCATRFADIDGAPRHIAVADNGVVYANLAEPIDGHGLLALRDTDGDGQADRRATFGRGGGTGLAIDDGWLYAATITDIYRYRLGNTMRPQGEPQHLVSNMPDQSQHAARGLALDDRQHLFVNIGAPSNACQKQDRAAGSPGQDPCPLLENHGGTWRFASNETGQSFTPAARFATGIRNMFALAYTHDYGQLYGVQHGRDQLYSNWPRVYTQKQSVHLPAEQLFAIDAGDHFGWPYCYYDPFKHQKVLAPEYGGDGDKTGRCNRYEDPIVAFPAHWAPMDMLFYTGDAFPEKYRAGAFVAFHGSWNRAPAPQAGYRVVFLSFSSAKRVGATTTFAGPRGFTGRETIRSPGNAEHRPTGLAQGPKGALYISDDQGGTIFKVTYAGQ